MKSQRDIAIIGAGRVGTALGRLAAAAKRTVRAVADIRPQAAQKAAGAIGKTAIMSDAEAAGAADIVLLTVPDDAIAALCSELAEAKAFRGGAVVAHCSGALTSDILAPARQCGCKVASMHPMQTFPTAEAAVEKLPGAYFFIEGDDKAAAAMENLARDIGGRPTRIARESKVLYHAAAVMACNYLTALLDAALTTAEKAGIPRAGAIEAFEPLIRATVDNVLAAGPEKALTGPIARGDIETVRRHLQAIDELELKRLYRAAGEWTAGLARRKGTIDDATAEALRKLMRSE